MGILDKIARGLGIKSETNIEDFMTTVEMENVDVLHEAADFYVKPIPLESENDVPLIVEELKNRNIVLLNVQPMSKMPNKLKQVIDNLKTHITKINGDIARLDEFKILLTPSKVKIVKSRKK
ncbi:MAG: cell division protein SepF [Candidatus Micrarchaeota archaeon]|nr:cell division protein SepF [Candidatus Micrarchaeota archaeon]